MQRRNFLSSSAAAIGALAAKEFALPEAAAAATPSATGTASQKLVIQLWSRHLQWVSTAAQAAADPRGTGIKIGESCLAAGFSATDLTVRSGGHVEPTLVRQNLGPMLQGIRSTGCICDHIGANFAPPSDATDTTWIASQYVQEILSTAAANGITRYRFYNSGGPAYTANTYGNDMFAQLDGIRTQLRRLAQIGAVYGKLSGVAETHQNNVGSSVQDYIYAMTGLNPDQIGINLAMGHVASNEPGTWPLAQRLAASMTRCTALQDLAATVNATTGALSIGTVKATGSGGGIINWKTFFQNLLASGYSGAAEAQIEYTITGALGTSVRLNNAFFADNVQFTSGNLTPAIMIASMKGESDFYRAQALAAGWSASQIV